MTAPTDRISCKAVRIPADRAVRTLVAPLPPTAVFSAAERRHCGASVERFAGRLAAKLALRDLLGLSTSGSLTDLVIVPGLHDTQQPCRGTHRPQVVLTGRAEMARAGRQIVLSISHVPTLAIAVCAMTDATQEMP